MTRDEALEKIRKLLATNGRTHAESDTAQIIAAAIAQKHDIDIASVDRAEEERRAEITHEAIGVWTKVPIEANCAASICNDFFETSSIIVVKQPSSFSSWTIETLNLVGTEHHLTIATHIFKFLAREFRWQWRHKRGRCKKRKQFVWGCYCGLTRKLEGRFARPTVPGANDLEISWKARRAKYIEDNFGKTRNVQLAPKEKGGAATHRGYMAGREIEIRPGVKGDAGRQPALIGEPTQKLLGF
jgi:hypothetical protein